MTDTLETPCCETGDPTADILTFAATMTVMLGTSLVGSFVVAELFKRKEPRECER